MVATNRNDSDFGNTVLSRKLVWLSPPAVGGCDHPGVRGGCFTRGFFAVPLQQPAVGALRPAVQRRLWFLLELLLQLFLGPGRLFFGFFQSLLLGLGFQAQLF